MDKRLLHVTSILGIQELLSAYPPEISVGQNNVAAARALITNPKIILQMNQLARWIQNQQQNC